MLIGVLPTVEVWAENYNFIANYDGSSTKVNFPNESTILNKGSYSPTKLSVNDTVTLKYNVTDASCPVYIKYLDVNGKELVKINNIQVSTTGTSLNFLGTNNFTNYSSWDGNWSVSWDGVYASGQLQNLLLKANAEYFSSDGDPITHSISYDLDGGSFYPGLEISEYSEGITLTLPAPQKARFNFAGWINTNDSSVRTGITPADNADIRVTAKWTPIPAPTTVPVIDPEPEPTPHTITYIANNTRATKRVIESTESSFSLPKDLFSPEPGQMFAGWELSESAEEPYEGSGKVYKAGEVFDLNKDYVFIAQWEDNPTFEIEAEDKYILNPPDNTLQKLTTSIRLSSNITYYEDGKEPEKGDTEKERKVWSKGNAIPTDKLEIAVDDPKAFTRTGTFKARIIYKGLYERTLEKTIDVEITDPNALGEEVTFDLGKGLILHYPSGGPIVGQKWNKVLVNKGLIYVEDTNTGNRLKVTRAVIKKSKKPGEKLIKQIKVKLSKKKTKTYTPKKLGGGLKFTIAPCYVWTGNFVSATLNKKGAVKSMEITTVFGDPLTIQKNKNRKKSKNPIVTKDGAVSFNNSKYTGTMTFEEMGLNMT